MKDHRRAMLLFLAMIIVVTVLVPTPAGATGSFPTIAVPTKTQAPKDNWCWACCGAACVEYTTGNTTTKYMFSMAVKGNTTNDVGATMQEVLDGLDSFGVTSYYMGSPMSFTLIKYNIDSVARPVIAGLCLTHNGETYLHMVTIKGYGEINGLVNEKYVQYMDPATTALQIELYSDFKNGSIQNSYYSCQWLETLHQIHS